MAFIMILDFQTLSYIYIYMVNFVSFCEPTTDTGGNLVTTLALRQLARGGTQRRGGGVGSRGRGVKPGGNDNAKRD